MLKLKLKCINMKNYYIIYFVSQKKASLIFENLFLDELYSGLEVNILYPDFSNILKMVRENIFFLCVVLLLSPLF